SSPGLGVACRPPHTRGPDVPYISQKDRPRASTEPGTVGELNYAMTAAFVLYLKDKGLSYQTVNDVADAVETVVQALLVLPLQVSGADEGLAAVLFALVRRFEHNDPRGGTGAAGALRCALLEFYHRVAVPYERLKCAVNGDVYLLT
ncbi:MAG: hypothetical protein ACRDP6_38315, partial [Actinoallomurus sp.]